MAEFPKEIKCEEACFTLNEEGGLDCWAMQVVFSLEPEKVKELYLALHRHYEMVKYNTFETICYACGEPADIVETWSYAGPKYYAKCRKCPASSKNFKTKHEVIDRGFYKDKKGSSYDI